MIDMALVCAGESRPRNCHIMFARAESLPEGEGPEGGGTIPVGLAIPFISEMLVDGMFVAREQRNALCEQGALGVRRVLDGDWCHMGGLTGMWRRALPATPPSPSSLQPAMPANSIRQSGMDAWALRPGMRSLGICMPLQIPPCALGWQDAEESQPAFSHPFAKAPGTALSAGLWGAWRGKPCSCLRWRHPAPLRTWRSALNRSRTRRSGKRRHGARQASRSRRMAGACRRLRGSGRSASPAARRCGVRRGGNGQAAACLQNQGPPPSLPQAKPQGGKYPHCRLSELASSGGKLSSCHAPNLLAVVNRGPGSHRHGVGQPNEGGGRQGGTRG